MYYTVAEVAKNLNMSPHTLRFYSKEGLLPFVDRSESGTRMFKEADFEWLFLINCLKKTGMPIKDIKQFIDEAMEGDSTITLRLGLFKERQTAVEAQIQELQEALEVIKYKRWRYEKSEAAGTTAVHNTMEPGEMPEAIRATKEKIKDALSFTK